MARFNNQDVQTRELTQNDAKFGGKFQQGKNQMIVTYPDGHEEVVTKEQLDRQSNEGQAGSGQGENKNRQAADR